MHDMIIMIIMQCMTWSLCNAWHDHHAWHDMIIMIIMHDMTWSSCITWHDHYAMHDMIIMQCMTWSSCMTWHDHYDHHAWHDMIILHNMTWSLCNAWHDHYAMHDIPWSLWQIMTHSIPFKQISNSLNRLTVNLKQPHQTFLRLIFMEAFDSVSSLYLPLWSHLQTKKPSILICKQWESFNQQMQAICRDYNMNFENMVCALC